MKKAKLKIKAGDQVVVISGKDRGHVGEVVKLDRVKLRVIVKGANIQTKHRKSNQADKPGEILKKEGPVHYSNVMLYNKKTSKGERTGYIFKEDGSKVRVLKKSQTEI